jgi:hypothetical protein
MLREKRNNIALKGIFIKVVTYKVVPPGGHLADRNARVANIRTSTLGRVLSIR